MNDAGMAQPSLSESSTAPHYNSWRAFFDKLSPTVQLIYRTILGVQRDCATNGSSGQAAALRQTFIS